MVATLAVAHEPLDVAALSALMARRLVPSEPAMLERGLLRLGAMIRGAETPDGVAGDAVEAPYHSAVDRAGVVRYTFNVKSFISNTSAAHHPSVLVDQSGGRGRIARMRRAMYRNPLVKKDVFDRASFFG